jgi:hypothetical protein
MEPISEVVKASLMSEDDSQASAFLCNIKSSHIREIGQGWERENSTILEKSER